eukprot:gnl/MRDRNA2_/MRDRNA2_28075_c0_seq1.p1 gnl/MRDRNA2_/MRDRNA2_28075_c0~~gnl/MRDRNA2_/MRDRNA2_28075_c0_seq1.p1  ORF type:complete len:258 (-),score=81.25 gnl/MRDRNA2_/MRDRNA2_28075_c0_seq1:23-796(-)
MSGKSSASRPRSEDESSIVPGAAKRHCTEESQKRKELSQAASHTLASYGLQSGTWLEVRWLCGDEDAELKEVWWPACFLDTAVQKLEVPDDEMSVDMLVFQVEFQANPELEEEASTYNVAFLSSHRLLLAAEGQLHVDDFEPAFWRLKGDAWLPKPGADAEESEEDPEEENIDVRWANVEEAVTAILEDTLSSPVWQKRFQALSVEKQHSIAESVAIGRERFVAALERERKDSGSEVLTKFHVQAAAEAVREELGVQ